MTDRRLPAYKKHVTGWVAARDGDWSDFEAACRYQPGSEDIILMTYPKSGTTWVQHMLHLMVHDMALVPEGRRLDSFSPFLERGGIKLLPGLDRTPRPIKTHLSFAVMPWSAVPRYVCVLRNPKDVCVSLFHHVRGFPDYHFEDGSFADFFELFLDGEANCGDYFNHLLSLWNRRLERNVLLLTYEDLMADPLAGARRLVDHVRRSFPSDWREPDLRELVAASSFEAMKAQSPDKWSSTRPEGAPGFIRKGQVGDWRNYLTPEQNERLERKFHQRLAGTGAEHLWPTEIGLPAGLESS
ncbi:sulfotransferase ssu-1 [Ixodes scapularis]|uniref:sulfotransferase ssu-1 n=1 Tax=Ixodes scapularis TaxID=6945 RepID=UPI001A9E6CD0|nr:sulfotransferase ssu-1 [Ixodes scapularis]